MYLLIYCIVWFIFVWFVKKFNDGIAINIVSLYSWLYLLLGLIAQQEWRVCELLNRILHYIEPRLSHSYQNVREKMGRYLCFLFDYIYYF